MRIIVFGLEKKKEKRKKYEPDWEALCPNEKAGNETIE